MSNTTHDSLPLAREMMDLDDDSLSEIFNALYPPSMLQFRLVSRKAYTVSKPDTFHETYITIYPCIKSIGPNMRYEDLLRLMLKYEVYDYRLLRLYMDSYHFIETESLHKLPETLLLIMLCDNSELLRYYINNRCDVPRGTYAVSPLRDGLWTKEVMNASMSSQNREMTKLMTLRLDRYHYHKVALILLRSVATNDRHDLIPLIDRDNLKSALRSNSIVTSGVVVVAKDSREFMTTLSDHSGIDFTPCMSMSNMEIYSSIRKILGV